MKRVFLAAALVLGASAALGADGKIVATGIAAGAHDATIAKVGDRYLRVTTGRGVPLAVSSDLKTWSWAGQVFATNPEWTRTEIVGSTDFWAPDLVRRGDQWRLYYAVSTFGSNRSAIGLATNDALDPAHPSDGWVDRGAVFRSDRTDAFNAIDPQVATDEAGRDWLVFGSFWSGIKMVPMNPDGTVVAGVPPTALAQRPEAPDAIEGAYLVRHGDFYYLFVSFDFCCKGLQSTYHIRVGRSAKFAGPYVDAEGKPLLEGGGTLVKARDGNDVGPGHNSILVDGDTTWMVYHVYDVAFAGMPRLRLQALEWSSGWPVPIP